MTQAKYSKFKGLEYNPKDDFCSFWGKRTNCYFRQILEKSALYASNFTQMNDIDEFRYSFTYNSNISKREIFDIIKMLFNMKQKFYFCSFSKFSRKEDQLMWAHYANGFLGIKIDFEISQENYGFVVPVKYSDKISTISNIYNIQVDEMKEIMTTKNTCWKYEREFRAIFTDNNFKELATDFDGKVKHYFPIQIKRITLGRKFCQENLFYNEIDEDNCEFNENVLKVARFIYEVLKNTNIYGKKPKRKFPIISAYKTKYSPRSCEISKEKLEVER